MWETSEIIISTGNFYTGIETVDCSDCSDGTNYDYTANSDTFIDTDKVIIDWANTSLTTVAQDWVCPMDDEDTCVTDFMLLNLQGDNSAYKGYLGLYLDTSLLA